MKITLPRWYGGCAVEQSLDMRVERPGVEQLYDFYVVEVETLEQFMEWFDKVSPSHVYLTDDGWRFDDEPCYSW